MKYCYKVKRSVIRHPEALEKYGFFRCRNEEQENEILYAKSVYASPDSVIVRGLIADLNNPDWQKAANITNPIRKKKFKGDGLEWEKQEDGTYKVIETSDLIEEFSRSFLIIAVNQINNLPKGILLIKGPDGVFRGSTDTLNKCCREAIKELEDAHVIYKVGVKKMPSKSEAKQDIRA